MPHKSARPIVGVLALQGDFFAHQKMLASLPEIDVITVRSPEELSTVDALVLPGGESTTQAKLLHRGGLMRPLQDRLAAGMPAYGTCAGLILLAKAIVGRPDQPTIGALNVTVDRNAFGRQVDSFEADIPFPLPGDADATVRGVFIRAPFVQEADRDVEVISAFEDRVVAVRQGSILGIAFHPELTGDSRVHMYFVSIVMRSLESA